MGTNYYLETKICECCGRRETKHIGKSSAGWCFALHVDEEVKDLTDWLQLFSKRGNIIKDDCDDVIELQDMLSVIVDRVWHDQSSRDEAFLQENNAKLGPNNLLRRKIDGIHCIGHGEGTWDLVLGDFS